MTTTLPEPEDTIEPTSDVIIDGMAITPTPSPVKADFFDGSVSWIVAALTFLVVVGIGFTMALSMGLSASVKHELTSTTYNPAGERTCHAFLVTEFNQDSFDQYQAKHSDEHPHEILCRIPFENNTNYR